MIFAGLRGRYVLKLRVSRSGPLHDAATAVSSSRRRTLLRDQRCGLSRAGPHPLRSTAGQHHRLPARYIVGIISKGAVGEADVYIAGAAQEAISRNTEGASGRDGGIGVEEALR